MSPANALQGGEGLLVWNILLLTQGKLTSEQIPEYRGLQENCILCVLNIITKASYLQHPLRHRILVQEKFLFSYRRYAR